ncbi:MAG: glycosyltransferase, partial [Fusobacteriaceae bacterium]
FYSDASSAILKDEFFNLGGYDFIVPTNEDVVLANNIIKSGKSFIYTPESKVYHSHKLSLKDTYNRYKAIGQFEKLYSKEIDFSNTNGEGKKLVLFVAKNLLKKAKLISICYFGIDILVRLLGYRKGKDE